MNCQRFEEIISHHCSPVLMGEKPANLVSFSKEKNAGTSGYYEDV